MRRTLVALWFADIADYSARAAEDEVGALRLVEILQALSRQIVRRYNGRVVKFFGDAVLAEFPSTELAVRAAAALSEEYRQRSAATGRADLWPDWGKASRPCNGASARCHWRPTTTPFSIILLVLWLCSGKTNVRLMCYNVLSKRVLPEEIGSRATLTGSDSVITRASKR
jgi:hypothetical protein